MLVGVIFLTIIAVFLIVINEALSSDFNEDVFVIKFLSVFIGFVLYADLFLFMDFLNPSMAPMDVYKGKTTIQYTIVDGIKTDRCVVWKYDIKE